MSDRTPRTPGARLRRVRGPGSVWSWAVFALVLGWSSLASARPGPSRPLRSTLGTPRKNMFGGWTLRANHLSLPFGMPLPGSYLWQREVTRGQRESNPNDLGGLAANPLSMQTNPLSYLDYRKSTPDPYRERGYSGFAEYAPSSRFSLGATGRITVAQADRTSFERFTTIRMTEGAFVRMRVTRAITLFAEADLLYASRRAESYALLAQLDYQPVRGLHLLLTGELTQRGAPRVSSLETAQDSWRKTSELQPGGWLTVDWLISPHFEARVDAIARRDGGTELLARFRTYF